MSFIKVHGLKLATGAFIQNAVMESLDSDLAGADLLNAQIGRMYYNNTTDLFMGVFDDGLGGKVLRSFAAGGDVDSLISDLASVVEGKGSDLIGYDGHTGSNGMFSIAASGLGSAVDAIVSEIDSIDKTLSTLEATYVNVAGDTMTGDLNMGTHKVTGLASPTADTDAATKLYVDSVRMGLDAKDSVRAATTENVDLTVGGLLVVDGVTLVEGDRVLVKEQTAAKDNGIYIVSAGAWVRATDFDEPSEVTANVFCFVEEGTLLADTGWVLTTNSPMTLGVDPLNFVQFSAAGVILAGIALEKVGNTLNVKFDNSTITLDGEGKLQVNATVVTAPLQAELDATQTGAGLNTDGTYVVKTASKVLSGAVSLADADDKLETKILGVEEALNALGSGSLTNLQAEVDATQVGAGLNADGSYIVDTTSKTLSAALSLNDAVVKLDDAMDIMKASNASDLAALTDAYTAADTAIKAELDATQTGAGLNADGTYVVETTSKTLSAALSLADADKKVADALESLESKIIGSVFTYQADTAATSHTITHNLNSDFVECQVWVLDPDTGKYQGDLVSITVEDKNSITLDLTVARIVRAIFRK